MCATTHQWPDQGSGRGARHYASRGPLVPAVPPSPGSRRGAQERSSGDPNSGEVRARQRPVAVRGTVGVAGPGWLRKVSRVVIGLVGGTGSIWTRGSPQWLGLLTASPLGLGSGSGSGVNRGPHGLLPSWRDPDPTTFPSLRVSRIRPSLTPGRTSGPRGQGPEQTNPGPGKPRADARIQIPSGSLPAPGLTRTEPRVAGRIVFPSGISSLVSLL